MKGAYSFFTFSLPSLNSFTPLPMPRISAGIFLPPKNKSATSNINIYSEPPGIANINPELKNKNIMALFFT